MKQPILEFENVSYVYPGQKRPALQEFSIAIPPGEKIAVIGRNGAGKSTFFLHCNGLYRPRSGQVRFKGQPLAYDRRSLRSLRRSVGLVFQNPDDQLFSAGVAQDISFGPLNLGLEEAQVRERVRAAAELCGLVDLLDRPTHALSGGEKARVALAGVLAMEPEVLISDELIASLDPWGRLQIIEILQQLYERGKTIIMATHDLAVVRHWATVVIMLEAGRVIFSGGPESLLANQHLMIETGLAQIWFQEI